MICLLNRKIGRRKFSLMKVAGWNPTVVVGHTRTGMCRIRKHIVWGLVTYAILDLEKEYPNNHLRQNHYTLKKGN